jgi:hypothetical protein
VRWHLRVGFEVDSGLGVFKRPGYGGDCCRQQQHNSSDDCTVALRPCGTERSGINCKRNAKLKPIYFCVFECISKVREMKTGCWRASWGFCEQTNRAGEGAVLQSKNNRKLVLLLGANANLHRILLPLAATQSLKARTHNSAATRLLITNHGHRTNSSRNSGERNDCNGHFRPAVPVSLSRLRLLSDEVAHTARFYCIGLTVLSFIYHVFSKLLQHCAIQRIQARGESRRGPISISPLPPPPHFSRNMSFKLHYICVLLMTPTWLPAAHAHKLTG